VNHKTKNGSAFIPIANFLYSIILSVSVFENNLLINYTFIKTHQNVFFTIYSNVFIFKNGSADSI